MMSRCQQIRKRIHDLQAQLARREAELTRDRLDLKHRAYKVNPGGDLHKKGTYKGHLKVIEGYRGQLEKVIAKAKKMGCL